MYESSYKQISLLQEPILCASVATVIVLTQFPFESIDGNPVPTILFKNKPYFFQSFILAINFSFFGSVTTIFLRRKHPTIARYCHLLAVVSMSMATGILTWLVAHDAVQISHIYAWLCGFKPATLGSSIDNGKF